MFVLTLVYRAQSSMEIRLSSVKDSYVIFIYASVCFVWACVNRFLTVTVRYSVVMSEVLTSALVALWHQCWKMDDLWSEVVVSVRILLKFKPKKVTGRKSHVESGCHFGSYFPTCQLVWRPFLSMCQACLWALPECGFPAPLNTLARFPLSSSFLCLQLRLYFSHLPLHLQSFSW